MQNSKKIGVCVLCRRHVELTFHHLIPRKLHRRNFFQKNMSKEFLGQGILICRLCHKGIHKTYDEMTLAKDYSDLDALQSDDKLARHFLWVAKQKKPFKK